jgi:hypothetical protein
MLTFGTPYLPLISLSDKLVSALSLTFNVCRPERLDLPKVYKMLCSRGIKSLVTKTSLHSFPHPREEKKHNLNSIKNFSKTLILHSFKMLFNIVSMIFSHMLVDVFKLLVTNFTNLAFVFYIHMSG